MQAHQNGNRRLDSWKEIATHLGRTERTAIRWEKKGLPVHRVPGGQRQAVFAYTDEIDAWLTSTDGKATVSSSSTEPLANSNNNQAELQPKPATSRASESVDKAHSLRKWRFVAAAVSALVLVVVMRILLVHSHTSASVRPFRFARLTEDGKFKRSFRTDGTTLYINEAEVGRNVLVARPIAGGSERKIPTPFENVILEDISNDGRNLLVTSFQGIEADRPLWTIPVEGGTGRRVGDVLCSWARWSPDNSKIACASGTSISILGSDGSDAHTIASFRSIPSGLLWSPDGRELRFLLRDAAYSPSSWHLTFGVQSGQETSTLSKLQDGKDVCWDWAWTTQGDHFLCLRLDSERRSSLFVEPSNSALSGWPASDAELPVKLHTVTGLVPGKADNSLYVLVQNPYRGELLKFDPKRKTFETYLQHLSAYYLSFSRDGQWMTYVNSVDQCLWRSRVDGTEALQLTKDSMEVEVSSWSPDGRHIAFMGRESGKPWRIFLIGRDGDNLTGATEGNDNQGGPSWAPDGKELIYASVNCNQTQSCWIRRVEVATGKTDLLPGSHNFRTARWSPDGKYIAALKPATQELMLFNLSAGRWTTLANSINGDNINWSSDSRSLFVDNPHGEHPTIDRIRITDGHRATVTSLSSLQNVFGEVGTWLGLTPDDSPILFHSFGSSEIYSLEWTER
jgi:Tol biopolymer transport system component